MPSYVKRTGRDVTDDILIRLGELEGRMAKQEGSPKRTSIDRGDTAAVPSPLEGQTLIQYDTEGVWYYSNGQWRSFTATTFETEYLAGTATVGSGSAGFISFTHDSGATFLDLTVPAAPVVPDDALYLFAVMLRTTDNVNTGRMVRGLLQIIATPQVDVGGTHTQDSAAAGVAYVNCSAASIMAAADNFKLAATNEDSISHSFAVSRMAVTKLS